MVRSVNLNIIQVRIALQNEECGGWWKKAGKSEIRVDLANNEWFLDSNREFTHACFYAFDTRWRDGFLYFIEKHSPNF